MPKKENTAESASDLSHVQQGSSAEEAIEVSPSFFTVRIVACGTDLEKVNFQPLTHDNPVILGLQAINAISHGLISEDMNAFYKYALACSLLNGLDYNKDDLQNNIDNVADIIKSLSLNDLKGGNTDGRPKKSN